jgi:Lrp/AsnC family transcriptional regulator for asnA, asnC and gidA
MTTNADDLDATLLALLEADGRLTNSEIARRLNLSESYVRQRLKRIFESGRVRRGLVVDFAVLGITTVACLRLRFTASAVDDAVTRLAQEPSIGLVMTVAGAFNVYAMAAARGTADLGRFLDERVRSLDGFLSADVSLIDDAVKYDARHAPLRLI